MTYDIKNRVARVIEICGDKVTLVIGETEHLLDWPGKLPTLGETFLMAPVHPPRIIESLGVPVSGAWDAQGDALRWRRRDAKGATRMKALWGRAAIRRAVRGYLDGEGFIEIDSPLLVHGTTPDATIQSFQLGDRYLVTSTEYQIKRLEVAGFDRIYTLTQNYRRDDGEGPTRNQEFTMLEWARVGQPLRAIEEDATQLTLAAFLAVGGKDKLVYQGRTIDLTPPWERLTVTEAIARYVGATLPDFTYASIERAVRAAGIEIRPAWEGNIAFLFSLLMDAIQPKLGLERPVFICDWPAFETSSAAEKAGQQVAERSELFVAGLELADGFPSMTDAARQKETFAAQNARRRADGVEEVALDDAYLAAMTQGLPRGAGMALGFDRLCMLLTDSSDIKQVLAFSWDEV